jgi:hypothetical protein
MRSFVPPTPSGFHLISSNSRLLSAVAELMTFLPGRLPLQDLLAVQDVGLSSFYAVFHILYIKFFFFSIFHKFLQLENIIHDQFSISNFHKTQII